jgi:hypothetical protein
MVVQFIMRLVPLVGSITETTPRWACRFSTEVKYARKILDVISRKT